MWLAGMALVCAVPQDSYYFIGAFLMILLGGVWFFASLIAGWWEFGGSVINIQNTIRHTNGVQCP
jgi:hypothetical protein